MARTKFGSPSLQIEIPEEMWEKARDSDSGGCLIADSIEKQFPQFTAARVDMATIRFSDKKAGVRYMYLTPPIAQHLLLAFDQGWKQPVNEVKVSRAVKVSPIVTSKSKAKQRKARLSAIQAKVDRGEELTPGEKKAVTRSQTTPERPTAVGPSEANREGVVHGRPSVQGKAHPNLLRGRDRHFGAKLAEPTKAFEEAVEQAVEARLAEAS